MTFAFVASLIVPLIRSLLLFAGVSWLVHDAILLLDERHSSSKIVPWIHGLTWSLFFALGFF